jgi:8-oxo-dGTP pyrophosphatase MutT (NUDIX family)
MNNISNTPVSKLVVDAPVFVPKSAQLVVDAPVFVPKSAQLVVDTPVVIDQTSRVDRILSEIKLVEAQMKTWQVVGRPPVYQECKARRGALIARYYQLVGRVPKHAVVVPPIVAVPTVIVEQPVVIVEQPVVVTDEKSDDDSYSSDNSMFTKPLTIFDITMRDEHSETETESSQESGQSSGSDDADYTPVANPELDALNNKLAELNAKKATRAVQNNRNLRLGIIAEIKAVKRQISSLDVKMIPNPTGEKRVHKREFQMVDKYPVFENPTPIPKEKMRYRGAGIIIWVKGHVAMFMFKSGLANAAGGIDPDDEGKDLAETLRNTAMREAWEEACVRVNIDSDTCYIDTTYDDTWTYRMFIVFKKTGELDYDTEMDRRNSGRRMAECYYESYGMYFMDVNMIKLMYGTEINRITVENKVYQAEYTSRKFTMLVDAKKSLTGPSAPTTIQVIAMHSLLAAIKLQII